MHHIIVRRDPKRGDQMATNHIKLQSVADR
jgi:hypothetical protein